MQRGALVDQRRRVVAPDHAAGALLHVCRQAPRRGQAGRGHAAELGHPAADEHALGVVVERLLGGRVDAQRIDAGGAALHLHLAPVDAGLEIQELAGQVQAGRPPVQPQVVSGEADEQRSHAKVDPARGQQRAHAGVDHRVAGAALAPRGKALLRGGIPVGPVAGAQAVGGACEVAPLDVRLVLELLHEVAMPAQPPGEAAQVVRVAAGLGVARAVGRQRGDAHGRRLVHAAHRQRAEGQVLAEPAAAALGAQRARQVAAVATAARGEKLVEHCAAGALAGRRRRHGRRQAQRLQRGQGVGLDHGAAPARGRRDLGGVHALLPARRPAVARAQPPHDPGLRKLAPDHAARAAPAGHRAVAVVCPARAGLLVAEQVREAAALAQALEDLGQGPAAHQQRQTARGQRGAQLGQRGQHPGHLPRVAFRAGQPRRLEHVDRQRHLGPRRLGQRRVVTPAQVALEPDQGPHRHDHCRSKNRRVQYATVWSSMRARGRARPGATTRAGLSLAHGFRIRP